MRIRRNRRLGAVVLAILAASLVPQGASAQEGPCVALDQDVLIAAGQINRCDLVVIRGNVRIEQTATQRGNIAMTKGNLIVEPQAVVDGHIAVTAGEADIAGRVEGDVFGTRDVILRSTADIGGDVRALGEVVREEGATVYGTIAGSAGAGEGGRTRLRGAWSRLAGAASLMLFSVLFGALAMVVAPGAVTNVRAAQRHSPWSSLGIGLLAAVLFPVLWVVLLPSVVGAILLPVLYMAGVALGFVALGSAIGDRLWADGALPARTALGSGILALLASLGLAGGLRLVCLSFLAVGAVAVWVLGSSLLTMFGVRRWPRREGGPGEEVVEPPPSPGPPFDAEVSLGPAQPGMGRRERPAGAQPAEEPPGPEQAEASQTAEALEGPGAVAPSEAPAAEEAEVPSAMPERQAAEGSREGLRLGQGGEDAEEVAPGEVVEAGERPEEPAPAEVTEAGEPVGVPEETEAAGTPESAEAEELTPGPQPEGGLPPEVARGAPTAPGPGEGEPTPGWGVPLPGAAIGLPAAVEPSDEGEPGEGEQQGLPGEGERPPEPSGQARPLAAPGGESARAERELAPRAELDLTLVPGITPIYRQLLSEAGIRTVADLARAEPERVSQIASVPGVLPVDRDTAAAWVSQAGRLLDQA